MSDTHLETKVIRKFIIKEKQDRYLGFIKMKKTRSKFLNDLYHPSCFKQELFTLITGQHENNAIIKAAKQLNVKDCYIISTNRTIDGKRLNIDRALSEALTEWADQGTLLILGDAEVVYREHESPKDRWISRIVP